jgi:Arc/MetJ-type ribon-helix-helix transcriptional regulator
VLWQARVPRQLAREIEQDMGVLGLTSQSETIREALKLLHGHAREISMARDYDDFYGGARAPLPDLAAEVHETE